MCVDGIIILFNTDMFILLYRKSYILLVHVHVCMWLTSVQECILVISLVVLTLHWLEKGSGTYATRFHITDIIILIIDKL